MESKVGLLTPSKRCRAVINEGATREHNSGSFPALLMDSVFSQDISHMPRKWDCDLSIRGVSAMEVRKWQGERML